MEGEFLVSDPSPIIEELSTRKLCRLFQYREHSGTVLRAAASNCGMPKREFVWSLFFIASVAVAQETDRPLPNIEASLVMEKQQFLLGEPIMMIFIARYTGANRVSLYESDAYGQCSPY